MDQAILFGRSPSGSADRNTATFGVASRSAVAPHPGARIETPRGPPRSAILAPSLPIRERGSKHPACYGGFAPNWSLPIRERGSKRRSGSRRGGEPPVAPHPAARIETPRSCRRGAQPRCRSPSGSADRNRQQPDTERTGGRRSPSGSADRNSISLTPAPSNSGVAPHPGARIETTKSGALTVSLRRRSPSGSADRNRAAMRWLSSNPNGRSPSGSADRNAAMIGITQGALVAPHPGARIETFSASTSLSTAVRSLPIRERGSKLPHPHRPDEIARRRSPSGSADRNRHCRGAVGRLAVAPHPGARIETEKKFPISAPIRSLPIRERGSKQRVASSVRLAASSLPIRERGSKQRSPAAAGDAGRRSPSGSADRNEPHVFWRELGPSRSPSGSADRNSFCATRDGS